MTTGEQQESSQATTSQRTEILVHNEDLRAAPKRTPPTGADESDTKRSKGRTWLQFHGRRQTRIGDAYQVKALPQPGVYSVDNDDGQN